MKESVLVEVSGENIPYFAYGRAYVRVGDTDKQLSAKEIEKIILKKNKDEMQWDNKYSEKTIKDVNTKQVKEYIGRANTAKRISFKFTSAEDSLAKLGLIQNGKLLNAAEVLFCDNNKLRVQAAVFAENDKLTFLDITQFEGNIFDLLKRSESYIKERMNWRAEMKEMRRKEIPEVPVRAITEALVNSLCHRDYWRPESNYIAIYKNRIEISNPGPFPEELEPEDYIRSEKGSVLRNPLIATMLYYSEDIERWGSGLRRIYNECKNNGVKVEFVKDKRGFTVVFYRKTIEEQRKELETTPKTTPKTYNEILFIIKNNRKITKSELATKLGITLDGVKYHMKNMVKKGLLRWVGSSKGGYWEIIK